MSRNKHNRNRQQTQIQVDDTDKIEVGLLGFDMDKIMDWVFNNGNENDTNCEITELYTVDQDGSMTLSNKQVSEKKQSKVETNTAMRYDFVKSLISMLNDYDSYDETPLGTMIAMNTMLDNGFLKNDIELG